MAHFKGVQTYTTLGASCQCLTTQNWHFKHFTTRVSEKYRELITHLTCQYPPSNEESVLSEAIKLTLYVKPDNNMRTLALLLSFSSSLICVGVHQTPTFHRDLNSVYVINSKQTFDFGSLQYCRFPRTMLFSLSGGFIDIRPRVDSLLTVLTQEILGFSQLPTLLSSR